MAFSGTLTLTELNDFITPSQACIKPVEQLNPKTRRGKEPGAALTQIHIDSSGSYFEVSADKGNSTQNKITNGTGTKLEQAQISLNDCLAYSGCITSAESVLITLQSHTEVLTFLESNAACTPKSYKIPVISIAPQSLASLSACISPPSSSTHTDTAPVTPRQVLRRLRPLLTHALGFAHVFDTTFARHLALREHATEFAERRGAGALPMLASACPGWICYAEKAHAEMLPFVARTKSPQQVMGTLVKHWMGKKWGKFPHEIYHVTVMPCYDKKLEASRQDFYNDLHATRDVDCVLTTGELELILKLKGYDLSQPVPGELDPPTVYPHPNISSAPLSLHLHSSSPPQSHPQSQTPSDLPSPRSPDLTDVLPELLPHPGTSSGSYLQALLAHVARTAAPTPLMLSVRAVRGADYEEYVLRRVRAGGANGDSMTDEGEVVFKAAKCYGFRNLQNVVRKVGRERGVRVGTGAAGRLGARRVKTTGSVGGAGGDDRAYDYVEVMACPGGCVNGGGQAKPRVRTGAGAKDAEGHVRPWEETGGGGGGDILMQDARWGDKEWTKRVEEAYWTDIPVLCAETESESYLMAGTAWMPQTTAVHAYADALLERVYADLAVAENETGAESGNKLWRTDYRKVESEGVGLAVKW